MLIWQRPLSLPFIHVIINNKEGFRIMYLRKPQPRILTQKSPRMHSRLQYFIKAPWVILLCRQGWDSWRRVSDRGKWSLYWPLKFYKVNLIYRWGVWIVPYGHSLQSCPALCDPVDGSPPSCSVRETLQARTLEWAAVSFSRILTCMCKSNSMVQIKFHGANQIPWFKSSARGMMKEGKQRENTRRKKGGRKGERRKDICSIRKENVFAACGA